jgi:flagellar biosynthesis/type III secretory pathway M-ring protein FliF/YscJ
VVLLLAGGFFVIWRKKAHGTVAQMQKQLEEARTAREQLELEAAIAAERELQPTAVAAPANEGFNKQIAEIRESFKLPPLLTTKTEILTKQMIEEARKNPSSLAQIVRSWLNESK